MRVESRTGGFPDGFKSSGTSTVFQPTWPKLRACRRRSRRSRSHPRTHRIPRRDRGEGADGRGLSPALPLASSLTPASGLQLSGAVALAALPAFWGAEEFEGCQGRGEKGCRGKLPPSPGRWVTGSEWLDLSEPPAPRSSDADHSNAGLVGLRVLSA